MILTLPLTAQRRFLPFLQRVVSYFYTSLKVPHPQDFQTCPFFPVCAYQQTSILPTGDFGIVLFFTLR